MSTFSVSISADKDTVILGESVTLTANVVAVGEEVVNVTIELSDILTSVSLGTITHPVILGKVYRPSNLTAPLVDGYDFVYMAGIESEIREDNYDSLTLRMYYISQDIVGRYYSDITDLCSYIQDGKIVVNTFSAKKISSVDSVYNGDEVEAIEFNTSNAIDLSDMYSGFGSKLTSVELTDTSKVVNMARMFSGCSSLGYIPSYITSNVKDFTEMFANCSSLAYAPTLDLSSLTDVANLSNLIEGTSIKSISFSNVSDQIKGSITPELLGVDDVEINFR